ncbi:MAG: hypothetical protein LBJ64_13365 [Deltaproteobacteria bacterium]|jgi:hypothetical protein|nr:hypothetical protein [Deltaproteobacteria bacterium]
MPIYLRFFFSKIFAYFVVALLVMLLWNHVMVGVVSAKKIGFWQAAGLMLLVRFLLGAPILGGGRRIIRRGQAASSDERKGRSGKQNQDSEGGGSRRGGRKNDGPRVSRIKSADLFDDD